MDFNVGDIIDFPDHAKSVGVFSPGGRLLGPSHGAPGRWRVTGIETDGSVSLEPLDCIVCGKPKEGDHRKCMRRGRK